MRVLSDVSQSRLSVFICSSVRRKTSWLYQVKVQCVLEL